MLLADERGKQALNAEIAEIKKRQKKRTEALRARKHALDIEKERSRRIAALPPPLPQSVKDLLKKSGSVPLNEQEMAAVPEKYELKDDKIDISEDKENALDSGTKQSKMKQSELNKKAKMRFNEALKKDRQKQECEEILKNIESAELQSRRQMAKNVTEKGQKIPCLIPDRMEDISKQLDMETAVEKISKKSKEHAIEDLEGYEDEWEKKYVNYSDLESKMIDCIPSFIKENYSYLLEDETSHQCGKRFTGLDTEDDFLNIAYIEDSPETASTNECEDISTVISHLDKMRSELKTTYEEQIKPLLEAEKG
ncbi:Centrosomal protein-like protein, partial [Stegodyphus mimosarum]